MASLRLAAFDQDDLLVISAQLENATVNCADMTYLPHEHRFVLVARRSTAENPQAQRLTGLHFERVKRVMTTRMPPADSGASVKLHGVMFETVDAPSGHVVLLFENQAAIRLEVECLEAAMADLADVDEGD